VALRELAALIGDEELIFKAAQNYVIAGQQYILEGIFEEAPFIRSIGLLKKKDLERMRPDYILMVPLFVECIHFLKGEAVAQNIVNVILENCKLLPEKHIQRLLLGALLGEGNERQTPEENDDLTVKTAKILINRLIETREVKS
jgi:hypothetical protein